MSNIVEFQTDMSAGSDINCALMHTEESVNMCIEQFRFKNILVYENNQYIGRVIGYCETTGTIKIMMSDSYISSDTKQPSFQAILGLKLGSKISSHIYNDTIHIIRVNMVESDVPVWDVITDRRMTHCTKTDLEYSRRMERLFGRAIRLALAASLFVVSLVTVSLAAKLTTSHTKLLFVTLTLIYIAIGLVAFRMRSEQHKK